LQLGLATSCVRPDRRPAGPDETSAAYRRLRRELLQAERDEVVRMRDRGEIGDQVLHRFQRGLDLEEGTLAEGGR